MCLAIAPGTQCSNNLFTRIWRRVARTPLRLFSFAAIVHLLAGASILVYSNRTGVNVNVNTLLTGFSHGVLALPVFGFLMTWIPGRYSLSPVHYGRYNSVYLVFMISLLFIEYGSIFSDHFSEAGVLLLISGWLIALQGLWNMHSWMNTNVFTFSRALIMLLILNGGILIISAVGQGVDLPVAEIMSLSSLLLVWPAILVITAFLVIKAPGSGRKISI